MPVSCRAVAGWPMKVDHPSHGTGITSPMLGMYFLHSDGRSGGVADVTDLAAGESGFLVVTGSAFSKTAPRKSARGAAPCRAGTREANAGMVWQATGAGGSAMSLRQSPSAF